MNETPYFYHFDPFAFCHFGERSDEKSFAQGRLREKAVNPTISMAKRFLAEFVLSATKRFFAKLRMTGAKGSK